MEANTGALNPTIYVGRGGLENSITLQSMRPLIGSRYTKHPTVQSKQQQIPAIAVVVVEAAFPLCPGGT
jgi:hypothetical protein